MVDMDDLLQTVINEIYCTYPIDEFELALKVLPDYIKENQCSTKKVFEKFKSVRKDELIKEAKEKFGEYCDPEDEEFNSWLYEVEKEKDVYEFDLPQYFSSSTFVLIHSFLEAL